MADADSGLPALPPPYAEALRQAVAYLRTRFAPSAIIASGTIVRGNPGPSSDLDLYVVIDRPQRQRLQRFFHGVPAEIFVNSPAWIERYFAAEGEAGRPVTAHMLATGAAVYDPAGAGAALIARAAGLLAQGPSPSEATLIQARYYAATSLEDGLDIVASELELARAFLYRAVDGALRYRFLAARRWHPRPKELLRALEALDPPLAELARRFYRATALDEQAGLAR
ncbi:MAG TPA: hypothetical protein VFI42_20965, partial [Thermomicrobiaceae bacterium]|nr:hypothetical protein [Thermomicrobiaceae bacterium]